MDPVIINALINQGLLLLIGASGIALMFGIPYLVDKLMNRKEQE